MRDLPTIELVSLISFFAVLLVFFSIDIKSREIDVDDPWHTRLFEWTSRTGGVSTAVGLALGWIDLFLPDGNETIHVALVAVPGSIGVACAIILGLEMVFQRK